MDFVLFYTKWGDEVLQIMAIDIILVCISKSAESAVRLVGSLHDGWCLAFCALILEVPMRLQN